MEALARTTGLHVDALADQETLAPGESATVTVQVFVAERDRVELGAPELHRGRLRDRAGSDARPRPSRGGASPRRRSSPPRFGSRRRTASHGALLAGAAAERQRLRVAEGRPAQPSLRPPHPRGVGSRRSGGRVPIVVRTSPSAISLADPIRGELRRPLDVVPALSVVPPRSGLVIVPTSAADDDARASRSLSLATSTGEVAGTVRARAFPRAGRRLPRKRPSASEGEDQRDGRAVRDLDPRGAPPRAD